MKDFIALFLAIVSVAAFVAFLQYVIDVYLTPDKVQDSPTSNPKTNEKTRNKPVF
jgi:hypothetical protein